MSRLKVLVLTRLFPSKAFPTNGTFCAERVRALSAHAEIRVMVPTPWWPRAMPGTALWRRWASVERQGATPEGVPATYPRFLVVPKVATWFQGVSMARCAQAEYARRYAPWRPDVIDAHFAFPDGYATARLARALGCPFVVTCHGSDLREYPQLPLAGRMLRWTLRSAARVVSVSTQLRDRSIKLGCRSDRAVMLPNGVDAGRFTPRAMDECRRRLGLPTEGRIAVCVGYLIDLKNQGVLIRALARLRSLGHPVPRLVLVGEGPNRVRLEKEARRLDLLDHVHFAGQRPYDEIPLWMGAADWLVLSSTYEGWATVYFEAMACGRPVITSNVPSAKDAVCDERYGIVVEPNTPEAFADALVKAHDRSFDAGAIRAYAQEHSWARWASRMRDILAESVMGSAP